MEDYYKILEVNQSASPETIDKVYKILVKKYHPDLQDDKNKIQAEEKIKKINEAYDILSNPTKREKYNNTLIENNISYEKYNELINENILLKNELNYIKNNVHENSTTSFKQNNSYYSSNNNQKNYNNYYNSNNYQKNKFEIKNIFKVIFSILITILIVTFIVINIPFIYNLFNSSMSILFVVLILFLFLSKK